MLDMELIRPFIDQFRALDVDSNGRLAFTDLRAQVQMQLHASLSKKEVFTELVDFSRQVNANAKASRRRGGRRRGSVPHTTPPSRDLIVAEEEQKAYSQSARWQSARNFLAENRSELTGQVVFARVDLKHCGSVRKVGTTIGAVRQMGSAQHRTADKNDSSPRASRMSASRLSAFQTERVSKGVGAMQASLANVGRVSRLMGAAKRVHPSRGYKGNDGHELEGAQTRTGTDHPMTPVIPF